MTASAQIPQSHNAKAHPAQSASSSSPASTVEAAGAGAGTGPETQDLSAAKGKGPFVAGDIRARRYSSKKEANTPLTLLLLRAPVVVEWGCWILIALLSAWLTLSLLTPIPVTKPPANYSPPVQTAQAAQDYRSPFAATQGDVAVVAPPPVEEVRETSLNLRLYGVLVLGDQSSATIGPPNGKQSVYRVGDEIQRNVTLEAVYPNQVMITSNGVREALKLPKAIGEVSSGNSAVEDALAYARAVETNALAAASGEIPSAITESIRFRPSRDSDGRFAVALFPIGDPAVFNSFGLEPGDSLISVDGVKFSGGLEEVVALTKSLENKNSFDIVVDRNGSQVPLTIEFSTRNVPAENGSKNGENG